MRTPCACMGVGALASSVRAPDGSVRAAQPPARGARPFRKPPRGASSRDSQEQNLQPNEVLRAQGGTTVTFTVKWEADPLARGSAW